MNPCTQTGTIDKITLSLKQQGEEDKLVALKVKGIVKDIAFIKSRLIEIHDKLSTVAEINTELEITRRVEVEVNKVMDKEDTKKNVKWDNIVKTVGMIVGILGLLAMGYFNNKNIERKLDNFGVAVPVNTRSGEIINLPSDIKIKMFPNDFIKDSI
jgi:hypothetical protein